jgi:molybdate transport system substrate-binding protein
MTATVQLYAAGSLQAALTELATAFEAAHGGKVVSTFGPSGLLAADIAGGAKADVFASANMTHPRALHEAGKAGPVTCFARNRLCALVSPGLRVNSTNLLDRLLDAHVKVGTSTPQADPSGDYAFEVFRKAEAIKPCAQAALEKKARRLTGAKDSAPAPAGCSPYGWHVAEGRADIFLTYRTNALAAQKQYPDQQMVDLPAALAIGADYGITVIKGTSTAARQFAAYIMSPDGQAILAGYGFSPGG